MKDLIILLLYRISIFNIKIFFDGNNVKVGKNNNGKIELKGAHYNNSFWLIVTRILLVGSYQMEEGIGEE